MSARDDWVRALDAALRGAEQRACRIVARLVDEEG